MNCFATKTNSLTCYHNKQYKSQSTPQGQERLIIDMKKNYFVVRNNDVENLPDGQQIPEEKLDELNDVLKYRTSKYGAGENVVDDDTTGSTNLIEQGFYSITLSATGLNDRRSQSKFTGEVSKPIRSDTLTINRNDTDI